jgi:hypothetical protein
VARKRVVIAALIERIEVKVDQIDIHLRPLRLGTLLDLPPTPSQGMNDGEIELLSVPVRLRRAGREIRMVINGTDSIAAKPDARLIKLLLRARRFNATLAQGEGITFAALAQRAIVGFSQTFNAGPSQIGGVEPDRDQKKTQPSMGATSRARARRLPKAICSGTADATARSLRWPPAEIDAAPGRVRQSGSGSR